MTPAGRIVRSLVMVAACDRAAIEAACALGADAICLDFEDLTPADSKERARAGFAEAAELVAASGALVMMRPNGIESGLAAQDLAAAAISRLHCVNLAKIESASDVARYDSLLDRAERDAGLEPGSVLLRPLLETARGVHFGFEIASASPRVAYMGGVSGGWWGDLGTSLGYLDTHDGKGTFYLRAKVLCDVRAAGVAYPISGGPIRHRDAGDLRAYFRECKVLGYTGVHCAATSEAVAIANEVFLPDPADLAEWRKYLPALEEAERTGVSSIYVEGKHLDTVCLSRIRPQLDLVERVAT